MGAIEAENPRLKGVLYREFSRLELEPGKLGELMGLVARLKFEPNRHGSRDVFGEVYEYFLGQFALKEGARAGVEGDQGEAVGKGIVHLAGDAGAFLGAETLERRFAADPIARAIPKSVSFTMPSAVTSMCTGSNRATAFATVAHVRRAASASSSVSPRV